jgi:ABC-2 type transport system ATP-binding protein
MVKPAVEACGLRKAFGEVQALDGLDLAVPAGSVLGLLGPNGSGKTTTVSILATSLRPDAAARPPAGWTWWHRRRGYAALSAGRASSRPWIPT